jgi:hypothetical protein
LEKPQFLFAERSGLGSFPAVLLRYLANLSTGRLILWCYFIWYLVVLIRYFDSSLRLWLTSLGLSIIIGFALYVSTVTAGTRQVKLEFWQTFRLLLTEGRRDRHRGGTLSVAVRGRLYCETTTERTRH